MSEHCDNCKPILARKHLLRSTTFASQHWPVRRLWRSSHWHWVTQSFQLRIELKASMHACLQSQSKCKLNTIRVDDYSVIATELNILTQIFRFTQRFFTVDEFIDRLRSLNIMQLSSSLRCLLRFDSVELFRLSLSSFFPLLKSAEEIILLTRRSDERNTNKI